MTEQVKVKYDKRVKEILAKLEAGRSRESISEDYDYSTYKSMDVYMRRKGFRFNSDDNMYEPAVTRLDNIKEELLSTIPLKAERIMAKFDEGLDSRTIAEEMNFNDHRELADYMKENNLQWDSEQGNYIEVFSFNDGNDGDTLEGEADAAEEVVKEKIDPSEVKSVEANVDLAKYIPMLELLYENKDSLSEVLLEKNQAIIPSYAVPGTSKNKSIYLSDLLGRLLEDFADTKNLRQKEIVETALIEYFKKYGYADEVKLLLAKK